MGKAVDLTGQRFGNLVAIERSPEKVSHGQSVRWRCVCDCGNETYATAANLRFGSVRSCGCLHMKQAKNSLNLDGRRFGNLVVVRRNGTKRLGKRQNPSASWLCVCDCGKEVEYTTRQLMHEGKKSCGCGIEKPYVTNGARARPNQIVDITGQTFGRLTVLRFNSVTRSGAMWECLCSCGNRCVVAGSSLRDGRTKSCGCLHAERLLASRVTHGGSDDRLYVVWANMKSRCYNKNNKSYPNYGGRGITICDEWLDYANFREWAIGSGYDANAKHGDCTIERIDVNGIYEPSNCTWVTLQEQAKNRRPRPKTAPQYHKKVAEVDEDGRLLTIYQSGKHAAESFGCDPSSVSGALHGKQKTVRGHCVRFATDEDIAMFGTAAETD